MKKSTKIGDAKRITSFTTIIPDKTIYQFPKDMKELIYLNVEGHHMQIKHNQIVLTDTPKEYEQNAITIEYTPKKINT